VLVHDFHAALVDTCRQYAQLVRNPDRWTWLAYVYSSRALTVGVCGCSLIVPMSAQR
jgi:hypothetical protein